MSVLWEKTGWKGQGLGKTGSSGQLFQEVGVLLWVTFSCTNIFWNWFKVDFLVWNLWKKIWISPLMVTFPLLCRFTKIESDTVLKWFHFSGSFLEYVYFFLMFWFTSFFQRRQWHPTPVLLPGKSHGRRSLVCCSPWGRSESDTTEWLPFHFSLSCTREGNGNPLQCSCLENPRDGRAS